MGVQVGRILITEGEETSIPRDANVLEEDEVIGSVFLVFFTVEVSRHPSRAALLPPPRARSLQLT
jgi:hypothetical protein